MNDQPLSGRRILTFVGETYEDLELWYPKLRLMEAGAEVVVAGEKARHKYAGKNGYPCVSDAAIAEMNAADFTGVVVPGGFMPDKLRRDPKVQQFVRSFFEEGKPVGAICHGPWTLIDAGVVKGRKVTSYETIQTDLENAGATWVDQEVVVDNGLVTSRKPDDLPAFNRKLIEEIAEGRHASRAMAGASTSTK